MANSSLGIYIDDGLIKYAKLQRDKDNVKVESFNVVFYDDLEKELNKIISETGSNKIPICLNLRNEMYNYFEVISMIQKKDRAQSIKIDFETLCDEKGLNVADYESRYLLTESPDNQDKLIALHVSVQKAEITSLANLFVGKKIESVRPIATSIINLIDLSEKENVVIVNLEKETKVTTIIDGMINKIDTLSTGMKDILDAINETENSERKSYEACKNTTIYTNGTDDSNNDGNEHLEEIMPSLYKIMEETKSIVENAPAMIHRMYITGLGSAINNIDLYFQEYASNAKVEILKPFFLETTSLNTSFKDYIEVNSAIALALDGIGFSAVEDEFNFKKGNNFDAKALLKGGPDIDINMDMKGPLDPVEKVMVRLIAICAIAIFAYIFITNGILNKIDEMKSEAETQISSVTSQIKRAEADAQTIKTQADHYAQIAELLKNLEEQNKEIIDSVPDIEPRSIPNMLKSVSNVIPQDVMTLSIKNTTAKHIVMEVVSPEYDQIGYFKALLSTNSILTNVKSSSGEKISGFGNKENSEKWVYVTIEGDLQ